MLFFITGMENLGLILISGLRTFILSAAFHFYTCSQDNPFVSKVVIWVNVFSMKTYVLATH